MNVWLAGAAILLLFTLPCGWLCCTASVMVRFAALQMAQVLTVLILLLLAEGCARAIYLDLALAMAVLSVASGLVYVRFLERWL